MKFTCIGKGHSAPALPATREEWEQLRREPWLLQMCERIAKGNDKLKARLPIWTPSCAEFANNHRAIKDAVKPLPRLMLDFDEKGHSQEILQRALELQEQGKWEIFLVEESVRKGTHVLITLPKGMTPQTAQTQFSQDVGFQADPALKDVARCIYMVPEANTLYVNERLFSVQMIEQMIDDSGEMIDERGEMIDESGKMIEKNNYHLSTINSHLKEDSHLNKFPQAYDKLPYSLIVEALEEQLGGKPEEGARNNFIFSMACHLRYVCNDNPQWIASILPTYGEDQEKWQGTIQSACNRAQSRQMPKAMQRALKVAARQMATEERIKSTGINSEMPPAMPEKLPPLIELLTSKVPTTMKPAVAHAVFPALGAHLGGVKFRYIDNVEHEATFMCCLLAKMSSGKSAVNKPIEYILADIVERDAENRKREQAWKDSTNQKGANKEKPKRPADLCIQVLVSDMTNAAFVQRLNDANGKFLYTSMDEIELLDQLKTSARSNQVSQIIRLAFDCGLYGQERVGTSSVTARVRVKWNWNASSTIQKGRFYFRNALADGTLSRINFCTIVANENTDIPVYGTYDENFAQALKPYIDHLNDATGKVTCKEAEELAAQLLQENADTAKLADDEVYESLSYRANVIAYLKAMTLYVANGYEWDDTFEPFIRWSEQYDLWCKMRFFGEKMQVEMEKENWVNPRGPQNMLQLLPNRFSYDDAQEVRRSQGKEPNAKNMLKIWLIRGYIHRDEITGEYIKSPSYLEKHS